MTPLQIVKLLASVALVLVVVFMSGSIVENLDASHIMVIQSPVGGTLTWHTTPGVKWQGFGKVTKYLKRDQFWFQMPSEQNKLDSSIPVQFNDGGRGRISGSIAWEMPLKMEDLNELHTRYGSHEAIETQLIRTHIEKVVYLTGPTMSSTESYAARKGEFLGFVDDQVQHGIYRTTVEQVTDKDPLSGVTRTVSVTRFVKGKDGLFERQVQSPLSEFGIRTFNLSINNVKYDEVVEKQIAQQQTAFGQVQIAIATAKEAEQQAITAEKRGQALAAEAKWKQEVVKAQQVTEAVQRKEVATLDALTAEQERRANILRGEGEAARKKLVMEADGALVPKLEALVEINKHYADAIAKYQGNWVPVVVSGGAGNAAPGSGAFNLMEALGIKAMRDLGVDLGVVGADKTRRASPERR